MDSFDKHFGMLDERAFRPTLGKLIVYGGGGKGGNTYVQPAPDYAGAAEQQAQSSAEQIAKQTFANRPTINTPWGQQTWSTGSSVDPSTGIPVTTFQTDINLTPDQQQALDSQMAIQQGRSEAAQTLLGQATGAFQTPFDWGSLPEVPGSLGGAQDTAYQKMSAALEPGRTRQREALETRLANMGLASDSAAYKNAKMDLQDQFTQQDKTNLAAAMAEGRADVGTQQQMRQAGIAEQAQRRGMTLNELNALLTGQQVSMPQMPSFSQASSAQPMQALGAATALGNYNLGAAQQQLAAQQANQFDWGSLLGAGARIGMGMYGV